MYTFFGKSGFHIAVNKAELVDIGIYLYEGNRVMGFIPYDAIESIYGISGQLWRDGE